MASLLLITFADETVAFLPFGALESIRHDVDLTYAQAGFLLALYPGIGLLATPFGAFADQVSRRAMAAIGGLGYGAGLLLFAAAEDFATLVIAVVLMGFAGDALVSAVEVSLVDAVGENVEAAFARVNLLGAIGDLVGPLLLAGALATGLGWRAAFWVAGASMVLYGLVLASQHFPPPHPHPDGHPPLRALLSVARDRRVLKAGLITAIISAFDDTFVGFALAFLTVARDVDAAVASLAAGAGMLGGIAASAWASRSNRRRLGLRPTAIAIVVGVVAVLAAPHVIVAAVGLAVVGAAMILAWITHQARFMTLRPGQAGATSSVVDAVGQLAILVPLIIGPAADSWGLAVAMSIYVVAATLFVIVTRRDGSPPGRGEKAYDN